MPDFRIHLEDREPVHLAGVRFVVIPSAHGRGRAFSERVRRLLEELATQLAPEPVGDGLVRDRHGHPVAELRLADGTPLALEVLRRGFAVADPLVGSVAFDRYLEAEAEARAKRRGLWGLGLVGPHPASQVASRPMRYAVVEGVPRQLTCRRWFCYLNFGADVRRDFTLRIPRDRLRRWRQRGVRPEAWVGRPLRVRGVILDAGGPMIELADPAQVERLP